MNDRTPRERPGQSLQILPRLGMLLFLVLGLGEGSVHFALGDFVYGGPGAALVRRLVRAILIRYWPVRVWAIHYWVEALVGLAFAVAILLIAAYLVMRVALLLWPRS